jgi:hypothetical protein
MASARVRFSSGLLSGEGFSAEHILLQRSSDLADFFFYIITLHHVVICGSVEHCQSKKFGFGGFFMLLHKTTWCSAAL